MIDTANLGTVALEKVMDKSSTGYDIIFTDINMPEMDGYTTAKRIREYEKLVQAPRKMLIIGLSAYISPEDK